MRRRSRRGSRHRHRGGRHRNWHGCGSCGESLRSFLHNEAPGWNRPWSFHKSDIDQAPGWPDHGRKRNRSREHIPRLASGGRLIQIVRTFCPAWSGHFVLGCNAVIHKSLISCIVRFGTWIAHSSSTKLKGEKRRSAVHSRGELSAAHVMPAKSHLNWPALLRV